MRVSNYTAITTLRILDGVRLPKGSTAELRSATPLGDVFVSIRPRGCTVRWADPQGGRHHRPGRDDGRRDGGIGAELGRARLQRRSGAQSDQCHQRFRQGHRRSRPGLRRPHQRLQSPTGNIEYAIRADPEALTQTAQLADQLDTKNQTLTDIVKEADPATETLAANTAQLSQLVLQIGATTKQLEKFRRSRVPIPAAIASSRTRTPSPRRGTMSRRTQPSTSMRSTDNSHPSSRSLRVTRSPCG